MTSRVWRAGTLSVGLVGLAAACRQLVGIGDQPPIDLADAAVPKLDAAIEAGPLCGLAYSPRPCEACLESHCCAQATACSGSMACSGLETCLGGCGGDPTCRARCVDEHRIGPDPLETSLAACLAASCAGFCGLACGGFAQAFDVDAAAGCQTCVLDNSSICATGKICAGDPECQALIWCGITGVFPDRIQACNAMHDAGREAFGAATAALSSACYQACALGGQWFCVGSPALNGFGGPTKMHLTIIDGIANGAIGDASVSACAPTSSQCIAFSTATSAADGGVTLTVAPSAQGPGANGYLSITGAAVTQELFYWGFPLSESSYTQTVGTLTQMVTAELPALLGEPVDLTTHAVLAVTSTDCGNTVAPGMQFKVTASGADAGVDLPVHYFAQGMPSPTADRTDQQGIALVVNVPPGTVQVTATPVALGRPSSVVSGFVVAGAVTLMALPPNQ
jgi:hypothetical protein